MILTLLLLALHAAADTAPRAVPRPGQSWDQAESLDRKLQAIEQRRKNRKSGAPESLLVTEAELNSFLNLSLGPKMPPGLSDLEVRLEPARISAKAMLDIDQAKASIPAASAGAMNPLWLLGGRIPVELKGRFANEDGFGTLEFEEIRLGPVMLPVSVLEQLVSSATRTPENPRGFDILAPFRLPYSVKRIKLHSGRAVLDF